MPTSLWGIASKGKSMCEANNVEKPGAVIPLAGICEGAVG